MRADRLLNLLEEFGIELNIKDPGRVALTPKEKVIYRFGVEGRNAERIIRRGHGDLWEIVLLENGKETVEQSFTVQQARINAGKVLIDAPDARTIQGLGRQLASLCEIHEAHAIGREAGA